MRKKLTINHWFSQHESSLHAVLNGYLDENLPDWLKETLFEHSIKSFYCNCGQRAHYCEHICALILDFLSEVDKTPNELFRVLGVDLSSLLSEPMAQTIRKQQSIPLFSELLIAMASHLPKPSDPTNISLDEILSQTEDISSYLLGISGLFSK